MKKIIFALAIATLGLSACDQKGTSSVSTSNSSAASAVTEAAADANAVQNLSSRDGKISLSIPGGQFADASSKAEYQPAGADAKDLILLQHDDAADITLYAVDLGKPKSTPDAYFNNLKAAIEADKTLADVKVSAASNGRLNYRFSQKENDNTLTESCTAIADANHIYNVCTNSYTAAPERLDATLSNIKLAAK